MADDIAITTGIARHGASRLPSVDVDSFNIELKDEDGFLGDRASKGAFRAIFDKWRKPLRKSGEDPFGDEPSEKISKKTLDGEMLKRCVTRLAPPHRPEELNGGWIQVGQGSAGTDLRREIRAYLFEDPSVTGPAESHHVHFFTPDPLAMQAWYAKLFGAIPGKRAQFDAADLPGVNLTFSLATAAVAGSKGRAVDHIGFEVKDLESFCKRLEAAGAALDQRYGKPANSPVAVARLTDPWGTSIELTEGLSGR